MTTAALSFGFRRLHRALPVAVTCCCVFLLMAPVSSHGAESEVIPFSKSMTSADLKNKPDSTLVKLSNGKQIRLGSVRRLSQAAQKMRTAPKVPLPTALRVKPAATGTRIKDAAGLAAALTRPEGETLQLPSGRTFTVGQLKLFRSAVERQLGHDLTALPQRPDLSGPSVKITSGSDWNALLRKPDNTVLVSPNGTRITVGEVKQMLTAASPKAGPPRKSR